MKYQPHIDGLRTLAVVPVVLYHFDVDYISGGFLGVDVFFVISGYLITSILLNDLALNRYSLMSFYKKRALRILPALVVVLLSTLIVADLLMMPLEKELVGSSTIAASLFVSNLFFWHQVDYFSPLAQSQPLLHTWSLAVEEQFYLFFPPLLFLLYTIFKKQLFLSILLICIFSFILSVYLTQEQGVSSVAFYLLPTRAWELGIGCMLAVLAYKQSIPKFSTNIVSFLGFSLVLLPYFLMSSKNSFPGVNALYSCLGAAIMIAYGNVGVIGKVLGSALMVWVGKISYSLYLWHWPLVVFWKIYFGQELLWTEVLFLSLLSIVLAFISTRYIEQPFRNSAIRKSSSFKVNSVAIGSVSTLSLVGYFFMTGAARVNIVQEEIQAIARTADYRTDPKYAEQFRRDKCFLTSSSPTNSFSDYDKNICSKISRDKEDIVLLGDSFSAMYYGSLSRLYENYHWLQINSSGCKPLVNSKGQVRCTDMMEWFYSVFLGNNQVDAVIIAARWESEDLQHFEDSILELRKYVKKVIVIGPSLEYNATLPLLLSRSRMYKRDFDFESNIVHSKFTLNEKIKAIAIGNGVHYIDVLNYLCDDAPRRCKLFAEDGTPMQFDYGHFTMSGADEIAVIIGEVL